MRPFLVCMLISVFAGCVSRTSDIASDNGIIGEYTFSSDSRYAGDVLEVHEEGGNLLIILEGNSMDLKPEGDQFRFTTGDEVWNKDKTAKVLEWFMIAYDSNKQQYYLGSPDDPKWRQYLIKK